MIDVPPDVGVFCAATSVNDPYNVIADVHAHTTFPVVPVKSIFAPRRGMSAVIVCAAENAEATDTLSCGSGTRDVQVANVDQDAETVP